MENLYTISTGIIALKSHLCVMVFKYWHESKTWDERRHRKIN